MRVSGYLDGSLDRQTAHELVREHLRKAILSGAAPGGTRLVQAHVAARLEVSTTPVREALRDLVTEGLVEFDPHRGAVVHQPNQEEVLELYALREAIEPIVLRFAHKRPDPAALAALAQAESIQAQLDHITDAPTWAELNWKFHAVLIAPASPRLRSIVKTLQDAATLYVARSVTVDAARLDAGNTEHHQILASLRAGEIDIAATHLSSHMTATLQAILSHVDGRVPAAPASTAGAKIRALPSR